MQNVRASYLVQITRTCYSKASKYVVNFTLQDYLLIANLSNWMSAVQYFRLQNGSLLRVMVVMVAYFLIHLMVNCTLISYPMLINVKLKLF